MRTMSDCTLDCILLMSRQEVDTADHVQVDYWRSWASIMASLHQSPATWGSSAHCNGCGLILMALTSASRDFSNWVIAERGYIFGRGGRGRKLPCWLQATGHDQGVLEWDRLEGRPWREECLLSPSLLWAFARCEGRSKDPSRWPPSPGKLPKSHLPCMHALHLPCPGLLHPSPQRIYVKDNMQYRKPSIYCIIYSLLCTRLNLPKGTSEYSSLQACELCRRCSW